MKNRWIVHAEVAPLVEWSLSFPRLDDEARRAVVERFLALGDETGTFTIASVDAPRLGLSLQGATSNAGWQALLAERRLDEPLPFYDALLEGRGRVEVLSTVAVRARDGSVGEVRGGDAGAILRSVEPEVDAAYARRFAGARPFLAPWSERDGDGLTLHVGFWSDVYWERSDPELYAANSERLWRLHDGLKALASSHAGRAHLPIPARP